jgi:hypothetical protein
MMLNEVVLLSLALLIFNTVGKSDTLSPNFRLFVALNRALH